MQKPSSRLREDFICSLIHFNLRQAGSLLKHQTWSPPLKDSTLLRTKGSGQQTSSRYWKHLQEHCGVWMASFGSSKEAHRGICCSPLLPRHLHIQPEKSKWAQEHYSPALLSLLVASTCIFYDSSIFPPYLTSCKASLRCLEYFCLANVP